MFEPTDQNFVDPDTDDLDSFSDLFHGKAQPKTEDDEEKVTNDPVDPVDENEDAADESALEDNETTEDAPDEEDEPEDRPKDKPKKNSFQERINELTARAREAERALKAFQDAQAKQVESAEKTTSAVDETINPDAKNEDGSDKYPLGEFDPNYIRDVARQTIAKELEANRAKEEADKVTHLEQEARQAIQEQWEAKLSPITEQYDDFEEKVVTLEGAFDGIDPQYSDYLVQTIKSLDHGPEVLYYFANNLEEANKFVRMGPLQATLALGEVNAMFKGQTRKETKVSKAPPPPQVNKGSKTRTAIAADTDDLEAFEDLFFKKGK